MNWVYRAQTRTGVVDIGQFSAKTRGKLNRMAKSGKVVKIPYYGFPGNPKNRYVRPYPVKK
jgi:hypothetical protein